MIRLGLVAVAVVVLMTAYGAVAAEPPQVGAIHVTATLATATLREIPPLGRRSDVSEESWRLNDRNGRRVGRMLLTCRWILIRARFCAGELQMPSGTVQVQGVSSTRFNALYAVIGGTGGYGHAGTMKLTAVGYRKSVVTVTITT